jgi:hypothetical protein
MVNQLKLAGISKVTDILVKSTCHELVRVIVYSNISPITESQPLISTTDINSSKIGIFKVKLSESVLL